ncbi:MAG TPA: RNA polymerase sigma factor [Phycisphaerae bacterium]|nr:RNA polymerase sigma factor [Phycisphaerae bacterium]
MTMPLAAEFDAEQPVIEAIQLGDRSAFQELVRRHGRWVRGVIFGVLGDGDRVDDVAQQVWQAVWSRIDDLRDAGQWRPWLYRLARNAAVDAGREKTRRKRLSLEAVGAASPAAHQAPDRELVAGERRATVLTAIRSLPALYREPFVLRHLEDWSYRQIGDAMGLPTATVETRLVRARQLLREALMGKV